MGCVLVSGLRTSGSLIEWPRTFKSAPSGLTVGWSGQWFSSSFLLKKNMTKDHWRCLSGDAKIQEQEEREHLTRWSSSQRRRLIASRLEKSPTGTTSTSTAGDERFTNHLKLDTSKYWADSGLMTPALATATGLVSSFVYWELKGQIYLYY